jgi:CelD/BcsL family acetyltransferase involved in cellulose biosynthesis
LDIIADEKYEQQVATAVAEMLLIGTDSYDLIVLPDLLESSLTMKNFKESIQAHNARIAQRHSQYCPYLSLPTTSDELMSSLGSETRASLRRRSRKVDQLGAKVELVSDVSALAPGLDMLFVLHGKRWALRGQTGNFSNATVRAFHEDVARRFLDRDWLKLYMLKLDGKVVASIYTFSYAQKLFYYQAGFNPTWSKHSPGFVLMGRCIEDAIARGLLEFDYLRGDEPYKKRWTKTRRETWSLTIVPRDRYKGLVHFCAGQMIRTAKAFAKRVLAAIGLRDEPQ